MNLPLFSKISQVSHWLAKKYNLLPTIKIERAHSKHRYHLYSSRLLQVNFNPPISLFSPTTASKTPPHPLPSQNTCDKPNLNHPYISHLAQTFDSITPNSILTLLVKLLSTRVNRNNVISNLCKLPGNRGRRRFYLPYSTERK